MNHLVLMIDDQEAHRILVRRALQKIGPQVEIAEAESLKQAREFLADGNTPSLVIVDLNLTDGRSTILLEELQQSGLNLPVLVVSTSALESDVEECYRKGASCYLTKSTDPVQFGSDLRQAVVFFLRQLTSEE